MKNKNSKIGLTLRVTATDIKMGRRLDAARCPLARALRRALVARGIDATPGSTWVNSGGGIRFRDKHSSRIWFAKGSRKTKKFVYDFDSRGREWVCPPKGVALKPGPVKPGSFAVVFKKCS